MPREKLKQKMLKHRISCVARAVSCVSFLVLAIIGVSSLARAMSLESIENQNGIPSSWHIASLGNPETITVPITYWDQREDDCSSPNRQFEWSNCRLYGKGVISNIVKSQLGSDGLPVPSYTNNKDAWAAYHDAFTANVVGNDPVKSTDNFYRWFHETTDSNGKQLSKQYDRTITFKRTKDNTYEYGSKGTFPLDDVDFSNGDPSNGQHNFHFTAHLQIPMKISADGSEHFWFSGDDDVWVFLNGQLVLDIGGLHSDTEGSFTINSNGDVVSTVQNVNDQECRQNKVFNPLRIGYDTYNSQVENNCQRRPKTTTIHTGFEAGDVVNLDFFYAERSTSESNTRITISNMQWPISADSQVNGEVKGKVENSSSNLVEYVSSVKNRDPKYPLHLKRIASYLHDDATTTDKETGETQTFTNTGFIPLSNTTLYYSTSLTNPNWQPVEISAPQNSDNGFALATPLTMSPSGQEGDTLYFRFFAETSPYSGTITNRTSYYTELEGIAGVAYDHTVLEYTGKPSTGDTGEELPKKYELNIDYRIDFGDEEPDPDVQAPAAVREAHEDGYEYSITSPDVPNFQPDVKVVEGKIDGSNVNRVVTYTKETPDTPTEKHKVVIHYVKTDGSNAFPDHVSEHEAGETVSVDSQPLEGYTMEPTNVFIENISGDEEHTVLYTPIKINHTVTVHYLYDNGSTAAPDYINQYAEGEEFSIASPVIEGYRRDIAVVEGKMSDHDREFNVIYSLIDPVGPVTPIVPDYPDQPTPEPELPEPSLPEEDDNLVPSLPVAPDDDLTYLGPLGEVAFVPNTGVISDLVAPIFEQYFAEVILSQTFVLVVLLIFAGSFATYFSLRKYLNLATAPAYTGKTKRMSAKTTTKPKAIRSPRNSKTAKTARTAKKK